MASFANTGPDHHDPSDPSDASGVRRANPPAMPEGGAAGVVEAATARATAVSRRFGSVRHPLTSRRIPEPESPVQDDTEPE